MTGLDLWGAPEPQLVNFERGSLVALLDGRDSWWGLGLESLPPLQVSDKTAPPKGRSPKLRMLWSFQDYFALRSVSSPSHPLWHLEIKLTGLT